MLLGRWHVFNVICLYFLYFLSKHDLLWDLLWDLSFDLLFDLLLDLLLDLLFFPPDLVGRPQGATGAADLLWDLSLDLSFDLL